MIGYLFFLLLLFLILHSNPNLLAASFLKVQLLLIWSKLWKSSNHDLSVIGLHPNRSNFLSKFQGVSFLLTCMHKQRGRGHRRWLGIKTSSYERTIKTAASINNTLIETLDGYKQTKKGLLQQKQMKLIWKLKFNFLALHMYKCFQGPKRASRNVIKHALFAYQA